MLCNKSDMSYLNFSKKSPDTHVSSYKKYPVNNVLIKKTCL